MNIKHLENILNLYILSEFMLKERVLIYINIRKKPKCIKNIKICWQSTVETAANSFLGKSQKESESKIKRVSPLPTFSETKTGQFSFGLVGSV